MHLFNQVLSVFQIIQFPRAAPWNIYFHISKLLLFKNVNSGKRPAGVGFTLFHDEQYQNIIISNKPIII